MRDQGSVFSIQVASMLSLEQCGIRSFRKSFENREECFSAGESRTKQEIIRRRLKQVIAEVSRR